MPAGPSFGTTDARLRVALESTLARWNAAACLDLVVTDDGPDHRIAFDTGDRMARGRLAQTTGTVANATIRILDDEPLPWHYTPEYLETLMMHEVAHLLAYTNDHVRDGALGPGGGDNTITDATLSRVCSGANPLVVCGCYVLEV